MKKINISQVSSWRIMKPDRCEICGKDAEYVLRAFSFWRGIRYAHLCEECRRNWINGILCV